MKKTIGIIGGMGSLATCDIMQKIISLTDAATDQDYLHLVVDCNTKIPDRTKAILGTGVSPVPQMVRSGIRLQAMGADVLIMPCNTAHYFYKSLVPYFDIPLLNMIEETISYLKTTGIHKAGLLATTGTISSKIYQLAAKDSKLELLTPSENGQKSVMDIIYKGVKAGKRDFPINTFCDTANKLLEDGAQTLILGCTELPLAMEMYHLNYPVTDPTKLLAKAAIHYCGGVIRN